VLKRGGELLKEGRGEVEGSIGRLVGWSCRASLSHRIY
jgi:hypothetical protein